MMVHKYLLTDLIIGPKDWASRILSMIRKAFAQQHTGLCFQMVWEVSEMKNRKQNMVDANVLIMFHHPRGTLGYLPTGSNFRK